MSSNGADMQAIRNRWLKKRKSQMAKWLNGFKPKPPKTRSKSDAHGKLEGHSESAHYYRMSYDHVIKKEK